MEILIVNTVDNPLLSRKEVEFEIDEKSPPNRIEVKEKIAAMHNADFGNVFVKKIQTRFGKTKVTGIAMVYDNAEATKVEAGYVKLRNMDKESREEAKKVEKKKKKKKKGRHKK
ncbi:MAG: 30S ribosomal protein S24e [Promethearchaeota archaeon]